MLCIETPEVECEDGSMVSPLSASFIVSRGLTASVFFSLL